MKRFLIMFMAFMLVLSLIAGCAAGSINNEKDQGYGPNETTAAMTTTGYFPGNGDGGAIVNDPTITRMIVRNATLDLEAVDVVSTYNTLLAYATQFGGYELNRSQSSIGNGYLSIDAKIRIKPEKLDAFLDYAATQAVVINSITESDDITDSYYDTQTRLKTMELSLENYYKYLDEAKTIDESLQVQYQINQLTVEIESLKGKLSLWDSMLAESLITIRLRQANDPVKMKKEIDWAALTFEDMGYLMKSGLMQVVNVLVGIVQWLAIVLVAAAPVWIIGLIIVLLVNRRLRKKRQKKAANMLQQPQQQPPLQQPPQQQPPQQPPV